MNTQPTCKERVKENYNDRLSDLRHLWSAYQKDGEGETEDLGRIYDYGLCFDYVSPNTFRDQRVGYFRYQLSWGGPSDEFRFYVADQGRSFMVKRIEYWFMDWFDGAKVDIRSGKNFDFLLEIFSWFEDTDTTRTEYNKAME